MIGHTARLTFGLVILSLLTACSAAPPAEEAAPSTTQGRTTQELPPPGYGTLRQDDFTVPLNWSVVQIKVTPLDESVIRLAAPDTYQRLHGLVRSRAERIRQTAENEGLRGDPKVFLVSFFTRDYQVQFEPTSLQLQSQGIIFFPRGILPLTPDWGRQQLKQEETQSALYLFDPAIDLEVPFEVQYLEVRSFAWGAIIGRLQAERGRVVSRMGG
jgi:hypothetical protein